MLGGLAKLDRVSGISLQIAQQRRLFLPCQDRNPIQRFANTVPSLPWHSQTDRSMELWPSPFQTSNNWEHLLLSMHEQAHKRPSDSRSPRKELRPQHQPALWLKPSPRHSRDKGHIRPCTQLCTKGSASSFRLQITGRTA